VKFANQVGFGCIAGGSLAAWFCLGEAVVVFGGFPYQINPSSWSVWLPGYLAAGMLIGGACALLLLLVQRKRKTIANPRVALGLMVFCAIAASITLMKLHLSLLAHQLGWSPFLTVGILIPCGLLLYAVLLFLSRNLLRRPLAFLCTPKSSCVGILLVSALAATSWLLPIYAASQASPAQMTATAASPNVLFVVLDTVRADHLGTYGYARPTSPALDCFAATGVVFENAFSVAPWTLPSHASMFTGVHPTTHGTGWENPRLADGRARIDDLATYDMHTLAEELSQRGYQTIGIAEKPWLSFEIGLTQGFEQFHDYSITTLSERFLGSQVVARYKEKFGVKIPTSHPRPQDKGGARVIDTALEWLNGSRERDVDRPFFMFMNLNEAHDPYLPPTGYWESFLPEGVTIADTVPEVLPARQIDQHSMILGELALTADMVEKYIALYDAEILYQDMLVGRLLDGLEQQNLSENTLVILVADHGEEFGEFDTRVGHQLAAVDTLLHVPLIMRYPPALPQGYRVTSMASTVDIFPTIVDVIERAQGNALPRTTPELLSLEGVSLFNAMQPGGPPARDMVVAHYDNPTAYLSGWSQWAEHSQDPLNFPLAKYLRTIDVLRTAEHKFFSYSDGTRAFLDLQKDPLEQSSESSQVAPEDAAQALDFELRLRRQLGSYLTLHEMLVGHLVRSRQVNASKRFTQAEGQNTEGLGYVGSSSGDGTEAKAPLVLPPFLKN
jgi:arylsulfatase A-like enzyme